MSDSGSTVIRRSTRRPLKTRTWWSPWPELAGQTFLELETMADAEEVDAACDVVRCELGISEHDLTTATYTDDAPAQRMA